MRKGYSKVIREMLYKKIDGLTANEIQQNMPNVSTKTIRRSLAFMPDVYIDRWKDPIRGQYQAVYCVVKRPPDCPHPKERYEQPKTRWITIDPKTIANS